MVLLRGILLVALIASVMAQGPLPVGPLLFKRALELQSGFHPEPANSRQGRDYVEPHHGISYQPPKNSKGKVGPVYTFVKTDYNGNFKWGVRHKAGAQYAGHH